MQWITMLFALWCKLRIISDWSITVIYMALGSDISFSIQIQRVTNLKKNSKTNYNDLFTTVTSGSQNCVLQPSSKQELAARSLQVSLYTTTTSKANHWRVFILSQIYSIWTHAFFSLLQHPHNRCNSVRILQKITMLRNNNTLEQGHKGSLTINKGKLH